jgi:hypothetical protein
VKGALRSIRKGEFGIGIKRTIDLEDIAGANIKDLPVLVLVGHREGGLGRV